MPSSAFALRLACMVMTASSVLAASVQVNHVDNLRSQITRVIILPPACPSNVDCNAFEQAITTQLLQRKLQIIPAALVRQRLFELETEQLTDQIRRDLAKQFGADAFVIAAVGDVQRQVAGSVGSGNATSAGRFVWGMFTAANIERSSGNVQIAIVRAEDGKVLMRGTGYGESTVRGLNGVLSSLAADMFERGFFIPVDR